MEELDPQGGNSTFDIGVPMLPTKQPIPRSRVPKQNGTAEQSMRSAEVSYKRARKSMNWPLFWARVRLWAWWLITKVALAIIYVSMIRDALATLIPALAQKISRAVPGMSFLAHFEETRRLDLAFFMAIFLLLAVVCLWHKVLSLWLYGHREKERSASEYRKRRETLYAVLAIIIISVDSSLFYYSMIQSGWGEAEFSWSALLATVGYLVVLLFLTLVTIQLGESVRDAKTN